MEYTRETSDLRVIVFGAEQVGDLSVIFRGLIAGRIYVTCVNPFLTGDEKAKMVDFAAAFGHVIEFKCCKECKQGSYDLFIAFSLAFRQVHPRRYNDLKYSEFIRRKFAINTEYPLLSDENGLEEFIWQVVNLQRFSLTLLKVGGRAVIYPAIVSYELLDELDDDGSFEILDWDPKINFGASANSIPPLFLTSPITLHIDRSGGSTPDNCLEYYAPELRCWRNLRIDGKKALSSLEKRGARLIPTRWSYGDTVQKICDVEYHVDYDALDTVFQLPALAMAKSAEKSLPSTSLLSVTFGLRYTYSKEDLIQILADISKEKSRARLKEIRKGRRKPQDK